MQHDVRFSRIRSKLIERARARELVTYGEFIGDPYYRVARGQGESWKIGNVLYEICKYEHDAGRPLLSAICVLSATGRPNRGFWELEFIKQPKQPAEREEFWQRERDKVWDYWQKHDS
jgi:hypothetical protein